jgi:hypothetical protein
MVGEFYAAGIDQGFENFLRDSVLREIMGIQQVDKFTFYLRKNCADSQNVKLEKEIKIEIINA